MEVEVQLDRSLLLCSLIASWLAIPASAGMIASLYFVLGIPTILLYLLEVIFSISFPTIAILITISYITKRFKYYNIAYFISYIFVGLSVIFFFAFFIGGLIYIVMQLPDIDIFNIFLKTCSIFFPFAFLFSMLLNIISFKKKSLGSPTLNDSQIREKQVEIQGSLSIDEKRT